MILHTNNDGSAWVFDDEESADYAYICSCMPRDKLSYREGTFIDRIEAKFRMGNGGWLTDGQWNWFTEIAAKHSSFIQGKSHVAADARALAAMVARGEL